MGMGAMSSDAIHRSAIVSPDGRYRYRLDRRWALSQGVRMAFVMLNPSTADGMVDDPTIRRCIGFAQREGAASLQVVNLFAYRATDPKFLANAKRKGVDIAGEFNDDYLADVLHTAAIVVAAWGAHKEASSRAGHLADMAAASGARLMCLGTTKNGSPRHPLYVRANTPLMEWTP